MAALRWTKQQDFCLRLGLLKALVAVMPAQRQPLAREEVVRRLRRALYGESAGRSVSARSPAPRSRVPARRTFGSSRADRLLIESGSSSWGQPIHQGTVYKVVEWGLTVGLLASGNRLSERGVLLRSLFDDEGAKAFAAGRTDTWNPFALSSIERAFFFYHLSEGDEVTPRLVLTLGGLGAGTLCKTSDAHKFTNMAIAAFLRSAEQNVELQDRPKFSTVKQLAAVIDWEVSDSQHRGPKPRTRFAKPQNRPKTKSVRETKKNADHQAIPRFEQLVDMGFLSKPGAPHLNGEDLSRHMNSWDHFIVTPAAERFAKTFGDEKLLSGQWQWERFARPVAASGIAGGAHPREARREEMLRLFLDAFERVRRPAGHTPFETAAMLTMFHGLSEGLVLELEQLHQLMLDLKKEGGLGGRVFFAAGNTIDRMYLIVKPDAQRATLPCPDQ